MSRSPHLVQLRARVDQHFSQALARSPDAFTCREGCDRCCHARFSVFEVEADPIREALARLAQENPALRARVREQGHDDALSHCALLVEGRCAVYDERPLICRSHGLPIAVPLEDEDGEEDLPAAREDAPRQSLRVDHCPLNFGEGQPIPRPSILVLDAVNRPLAMIDALSHPGARRVELSELAKDG